MFLGDETNAANPPILGQIFGELLILWDGHQSIRDLDSAMEWESSMMDDHKPENYLLTMAHIQNACFLGLRILICLGV